VPFFLSYCRQYFGPLFVSCFPARSRVLRKYSCCHCLTAHSFLCSSEPGTCYHRSISEVELAAFAGPPPLLKFTDHFCFRDKCAVVPLSLSYHLPLYLICFRSSAYNRRFVIAPQPPPSSSRSCPFCALCFKSGFFLSHLPWMSETCLPHTPHPPDPGCLLRAHSNLPIMI